MLHTTTTAWNVKCRKNKNPPTQNPKHLEGSLALLEDDSEIVIDCRVMTFLSSSPSPLACLLLNLSALCPAPGRPRR
jgi:hypothetical protein